MNLYLGIAKRFPVLLGLFFAMSVDRSYAIVSIQGSISSDDHGEIWFVTDDGKLHALSIATGSPNKSFISPDLGSPVLGQPVVQSDSVYVATIGGKIFRVNTKNGHVDWSTDLSVQGSGYSIRCTPAIAYGQIYVIDNHDKLYALNEESGAIGPTQQISIGGGSDAGLRSPVVFGPPAASTVWLGGADNAVHQYSGGDLTPQKTVPTGGVITSTPYINGDGIGFIGNEKGKVYVFNAGTGDTLGFFDAVEPIRNGMVGTGETDAYGVNSLGSFFKVNVTNSSMGQVVTGTNPRNVQFRGSFEFQQSPAILGNTLWVGDTQGIAHAINLDGTGKTDIPLSDSPLTTPAVDSTTGTVVFASKAGRVFALNNDRRKLIWVWTSDGLQTEPLPPIANDQSVSLLHDRSTALILATSKPNVGNLSYSVVTPPAHGTLTGSAPNLTYTPANGYVGTDAFTFKAIDGSTPSNIATVTLAIRDTAPVADNQSVTATQETPLPITLAATDADDDQLTYSVVNPPAHGTLAGAAPSLTYTPTKGFVGDDSFTFKVNDGALDSNTSTVSITINPKPPIANDQSVSLLHDRSKALILVATDTDGDSLTYSVVAQPTHGEITGKPPVLAYTPAKGYVGADSFTFQATDRTVTGNVATVALTITDTVPVAANQSVTATQETPLPIPLTATDADADSLTYSVESQPTHGSLMGAAPDLTYTPTNGYSGNDSFTFKVNDGALDSATATVSIIVKSGEKNTIPPKSMILIGPANASMDCTDTATFTFTGTDDETATASLLYRWRVDGGPWQGPISATSVNLSKLADGLHTFEVAAIDEAGNIDPNPPSRSFTVNLSSLRISDVHVDDVTAATAALHWQTSQPATSQVEYRKDFDANWTTLPQDSSLSLFHQVGLTGLASGTLYHFQVLSTDGCAHAATSADATFMTVLLPDLTITPVASPTAGGTGESLSLSWQVNNVGTGTTTVPWNDCIYLEGTAPLPQEALISCVEHTGGLSPNTNYQQNSTLTLPEVPSGSYQLLYRTDAGNNLPESNEANNSAVAGTIRITAVVPPVIAPITDGTVADGQPYTGPTPTLQVGTPPITWSLVSGPSGMTINPNTGVVKWPKAIGASAPYTITIQAANVSSANQASWKLTVSPGYTATVSTSVTVAPTGTPVSLTGYATTLPGNKPAPNVPVALVVAVQGTRRVFMVTTDSSGNFQYTFQPLPNEAGQYSVGAKYPDVEADPVQAQFTLVGMETDPSTITQTLTPNHPATGQTTPNNRATGQAILKNRGDTPLSDLTATVQGAPAGLSVTVDSLSHNLDPLGSGLVHFTVVAETNVAWSGTVNLSITSAEGAVVTLPLQLTIIPSVAMLTANPSPLNIGMVRGMRKLVQFDVTNTGGAPTDSLQLLIPSPPWLSLVSTSTLGPILAGGKATVVLALDPASDLTLGNYNGTIIVGGDKPYGISVPFQFTAISSGMGSLQVFAEDEFTFYGQGAPRVAGAAVTLTDSATMKVIATGVTGADGSITFPTLPEAYYDLKISADQHTAFDGPIQVQAGQMNQVHAFISRELVSYAWTVTPTSVEDQYNITVDAIFQTNVPAPVITIDPSYIDLSKITQPTQVNLTITNHGLIAAQGMKINLADGSDFEVKSLVTDIGDIAANTSVIVPVLIQPKPANSSNLNESNKIVMLGTAPSTGGCYPPVLVAAWVLLCGEPVTYEGIVHFTGLKLCTASGGGSGAGGGGGAGGSGSGGGGAGGSGAGGGGGGGGWDGKPIVSSPVIYKPLLCDPCATATISAAGDCATNLFLTVAELGGKKECFLFGKDLWDTYHSCLEVNKGTKHKVLCAISLLSSLVDAGKCIGKELPVIGQILTLANCAFGIAGACEGLDHKPSLQESVHAFSDDSISKTYLMVQANRLKAYAEPLLVLFGDPKWLEGTPGDEQKWKDWIAAFQSAISPSSESGATISPSEDFELLNLSRPRQLNQDDVQRFIERWNRTISYWEAGIENPSDLPLGVDNNFISAEQIETAIHDAADAEQKNINDGFSSFYEGISYAVNQVINEVNSPQPQGVCAKVKVQLDQQAIISRSGFKATLEIDNSGAMPLQKVSVSLDIKDPSGRSSDSLFALQGPVLTGISDVSGSGSIPGKSKGAAVWTLTPSDYAAPDGDMTYTVGGTLSYTLNGVQVNIPLYPASITVLPNPSLYLDYFWAKDVYSDDPFTPQVEPAEPFAVGLLVTNKGKGTANDFRITSAQPTIVDNQKGLLVDFNLIGSLVNGQSVNPSFTMYLGNIVPGQTRVGEWILLSSLQGTFIGFDATVQHVTDLGQSQVSSLVDDKKPDFSIIDGIAVHQLIHPVRADLPVDDGAPDFLANDLPDPNSAPDTLYTSDGAIAPVTSLLNGVTDGDTTGANLQVHLRVPATSGWVYIEANDPSHGDYTLLKVVRSDGRVIRMDDNAWTTHRTIRIMDQSPYKQDIVHLFDHDTTGSYTLIYGTASVVLNSIDPEWGLESGPSFTLNATGSGFTSDSVIYWNKSPRPTTFVSSTQLTAQIPATDLASAGSATVEVVSPLRVGQSSGSMNFTIRKPGDLTGRGEFDIVDIQNALQIAVGLRPATSYEMEALDVRPKPGTNGRPFGDGKVRIDDVIWLLEYLVGLETHV